jgi:glycine betaine/proline transport system substrate-binding protein
MIRTFKLSSILALFIALTMFLAVPAQAKNNKITFANVGWTGVTVKTELASTILESMGYDTEVKMLSVQLVYTAMSMGDADVFLGNWMPSMKSISQKYFDDGSVIQLVANMPGAKYTLAVPAFMHEAGLRDFSDIAKFKDKLNGKIHGIEAGNDGNKIILDMIKQDKFGLGDFELIPSSEPAMLTQVQSYADQGKWIVFLGWGPHHMNEIIDMKYLTGSDNSTFGPNDGSATIYTNVRKGFTEDYPNVTKMLENMIFPIEMMNKIMLGMHEDKKLTHLEAGVAYLKNNPEIYKGWLDGVTTTDGGPAVKAFEAYLAKH